MLKYQCSICRVMYKKGTKLRRGVPAKNIIMGGTWIQIIIEALGLDERECLEKSSRKWLGLGECLHLKSVFRGRNRNQK